MVAHWQRLEAWLWNEGLRGGDRFTHSHLMSGLGLSGYQTTRIIQDYVAAQGRRGARTFFIIRRMPGTRGRRAVWCVGERAADVRGLGAQWVSDARRRIDRVIEPTIFAIAKKNPRAARTAKAYAAGIDAALAIMAVTLDGEDA